MPLVPASLLMAATVAGAVAFVALALAVFARPATFRRWPLACALGATGLWLLLCASEGHGSVGPMLGEVLRNLCWLWFMAAIAGGREEGYRVTPIGVIYIGLFTLENALGLIAIAVLASGGKVAALESVSDTVHMLFAAGALVLLHNLIEAARAEERKALALPLGALCAMWMYDLTLYAIGYLSGHPANLLMLVRPMLMLGVAAAFAIAALRPAGQAVSLSRRAAFRSLGVAAVTGWLVLLSLFSGVINRAGGDYSARAQAALLAASIVGGALVLISPRLRAIVRVWTTKHFFEHRYDYREEWLRFTATLNRPAAAAAAESTDARVVKALADIVESAGGVLIAPDHTRHFSVAAAWPKGALALEHDIDWAPLIGWMTASGRIVEFDSVRRGQAPADEASAVVPALRDAGDLWIAVPLLHMGELEGIVLLGRPPLDRSLDWEDFDLLKVAGRQAASHLAEARGAEALAESVRFEEFHRRFAFIMHDVKNLASQMGVLARNAERHGDNPAFREDMVATLRLSAERLTQLMQRLSQQDKVRIERLERVDLGAIVMRVALAKRPQHAIEIIDGGAPAAWGHADTAEQLLLHLTQNAIDATRGPSPVRLRVSADAASARVSVEDDGVGMSPEFVRTRLFRPFSSTKEGGFGIGAYQARQLAEAIGGTLSVDSREGQGTRFILSLPLAREDAAPLAGAAPLPSPTPDPESEAA
jgi:putative PEP-CTERM system histidine kinase